MEQSSRVLGVFEKVFGPSLVFADANLFVDIAEGNFTLAATSVDEAALSEMGDGRVRQRQKQSRLDGLASHRACSGFEGEPGVGLSVKSGEGDHVKITVW